MIAYLLLNIARRKISISNGGSTTYLTGHPAWKMSGTGVSLSDEDRGASSSAKTLDCWTSIPEYTRKPWFPATNIMVPSGYQSAELRSKGRGASTACDAVPPCDCPLGDRTTSSSVSVSTEYGGGSNERMSHRARGNIHKNIPGCRELRGDTIGWDIPPLEDQSYC